MADGESWAAMHAREFDQAMFTGLGGGGGGGGAPGGLYSADAVGLAREDAARHGFVADPARLGGLGEQAARASRRAERAQLSHMRRLHVLRAETLGLPPQEAARGGATATAAHGEFARETVLTAATGVRAALGSVAICLALPCPAHSMHPPNDQDDAADG